MPNEMSSWKPLTSASSRLHSVRDFLSQRDLRGAIPTRRPLQPGEAGYVDGLTTPQTWSQWAGQKIKRNQGNDSGRPGVDGIILFPGWAARRYRQSESGQSEEAFEVDVFVSGYASTQRPPELATRSQRAFLRLAKGFASLPKLPGPKSSRSDEEYTGLPISRSTEELLASVQLPPRPTEITEEYEIQVLEKQFRRAEVSTHHIDSGYLDQDIDSLSPTSSTPSRASSRPPSPSSSVATSMPSTASSSTANIVSGISADVRRLHANLESRLQPFWSSAISSRLVRISLSASPHQSTPSRKENDDGEGYFDCGPVATKDVLTASDGSFQAKFTIPWEDMCQHPYALHIAFGQPTEEHDLIVAAELLPVSPSTQQNSTARSFPLPQTQTHNPPPQATLRVSLTHSQVRVISDIDDTVKMSNILSGARAVFYNVFVKDLREIVIPGMGEWYFDMWTRGVRFHYVSNGPFELLPVVNEFFQVSQLPPGSIKLKSYAGRSLFNGLLSAPATRKRAGIADVLDAFPASRFLLVGDSGEQDLELYASFAVERPKQVLGVFVRDANTYDDGVEGVEDPTGFKRLDGFLAPLSSKLSSSPQGVLIAGSVSTPTSSDVLQPPRLPQRNMTDPAVMTKPLQNGSSTFTNPSRQPSRLSIPTIATGYFTPSSSATASLTRLSPSPLTDEPSSYTNPPDSVARPARRSQQSLSDSEKKRAELQVRIYRARTQMPAHIPLRIFRKPEECIEAGQILDKLHIGTTES